MQSWCSLCKLRHFTGWIVLEISIAKRFAEHWIILDVDLTGYLCCKILAYTPPLLLQCIGLAFVYSKFQHDVNKILPKV